MCSDKVSETSLLARNESLCHIVGNPELERKGAYRLPSQAPLLCPPRLMQKARQSGLFPHSFVGYLLKTLRQENYAQFPIRLLGVYRIYRDVLTGFRLANKARRKQQFPPFRLEMKSDG